MLTKQPPVPETLVRSFNKDHNNPEVLHVWHSSDSINTLIPLFQDSVRSRLVKVESPSLAKIQLLDWRIAVSFDALEPHLPALIVVDNNFVMPVGLPSARENDSEINFSLIELVSFSELYSPVLEFRILKLLQTAKLYAKSLVKNNAEIILEAVMENSNDWMVVKSLDHRFLQVSGKFCRAKEKEAHQILGLNDLELGTSEELVLGRAETNWQGFWAFDKMVTDSGDVLVNPPVQVDADQNLYEGMDKVPLRDSNGKVFALLVCVYRYTTRTVSDDAGSASGVRHEKSNDLWENSGKLSEFPALAAATRDRAKALESMSLSERELVAKNRFIATASHDLRQPLHAIGFYIAALEPKINEGGEEIVDKLKRCVASLNKLLTSLLDVSKLDANVVTAELRDIFAADLLTSLVTEYESVAHEKSIDIVCGCDDSWVYSDPVLLRRVLSNLLVNALNNTREGKVSLSVQHLGAYIEIVVADTGIGIPLDKQDLVFEEFFKIESQSQDTPEGMGLGLSIVKRLCNLLDIALRMESLPDEGTRVILTVPIARNIEARELHVKSPTDGVGTASEREGVVSHVDDPLCVLLIDDNKEVCTAVGMLLGHQGYNVVTATGVDSALAQLQESSVLPDAMLVDFRLSHDMTGPEAIAIVADQIGVQVPALIITGDTTDEGLKEIAASGFRHIHKPVVVDELLAILDQMLQEDANRQKL